MNRNPRQTSYNRDCFSRNVQLIFQQSLSQISKNWRGRPLESLEIIVSLIGATTTKTGLTVKCVVDSNEYPKGVKIGDSQLASLNLTANDWHGEWNYVIAPQT